MNPGQSNQELHWNTADLDSAETADDLLDRTRLIDHLARGLLKSRTGESLVTAIYGPWGSGKSWIKHRLVEELCGLSPELAVVEFAPWQIRGVDELTLQFFSQVFEQIDPPPPSGTIVSPSARAQLWAHLARLSGVVPAAVRIVGGAAATITGDANIAVGALAAAGTGDEFAKLVAASAEDARRRANESSKAPRTLEETRDKLAADFNSETGPRLLVIMDDFDRLTAEEIQAMMRLIKANANFPGLNYLLLCDPEQISLALDDVTSGRGREFLEKIVQNPVRLPLPDVEKIFLQLCSGLNAIARRLNIPFDPTEDRVRYYFNGFLHIKLRNLRSVYRLIDALDFSTAALTRSGQLEVDLIDLCAIEYLRLHMPRLANWIHEQGAHFFSSGGMFGRWHSNEEKPKFSTLLPEQLRSDPGVAECYSVLRQLFPSIEPSVDLDRAHARAITHFVCTEKYPLSLRDEEHFDAYFVFQPSLTKVPEGEFRSAWNDLVSGHFEKLDLSDWSSKGWLISALKRFDMELSSLTSTQKQDLFIAFAKHADNYGYKDSPQNLFEELRWASNFMELLLKDQPESERVDLLERLFTSKTSIYARMLFLENLWIRNDPDFWKERQPRSGTPLMSRQRINELQSKIAPAVEKAIAQNNYLDHPMLASRLYRWVNSVGLEYTGPAMRRFLANEQTNLIWHVIQGVARSISPEFRMSFEFSSSYADPNLVAASDGFFKELMRFADRDFWGDFEQSQRLIYPMVQTPKNGDACLIHHLRRALKNSTTTNTT